MDETSFVADTEATGPAWRLRSTKQSTRPRSEDADARHLNGRGFKYRESAPVTGDAGGIYYIYLESLPFTYNGRTIRIKHNLRLLSPLNYRVAISLSDNGGPFINYGNPWWRKQ